MTPGSAELNRQPNGGASDSPRAFDRKVVDVRHAFRDTMAGHLVDGRVADKEKLEQAKLKISASLVNFVVSGGVLLFEYDDPGPPPMRDQLDQDGELTETDMFHLLRETIFRMLNELNKPDVNLLKVSLTREFRSALRAVFTGEDDSDSFPVKIFQDVHGDGRRYYIGVNMRNTRSVGEDIDRIERDPGLRAEITSGSRPCRRTDGNLTKMFASDRPAGE